MRRELPDYLRPELDVVFVGFNPGDRSSRIGHYYAGRGNQFWNFLFESGLAPERLRPEDDRRVLEFGLGLTDVVKRWSKSSNDLRTADYREGIPLLRAKLKEAAPRAIAFNGKVAYEKFSGCPVRLGLQRETFEGARVFVLPSTSGRTVRLTLVRKIRRLPKLVVACVNGPAAGAGVNLALACDLRIASESATFTQAFLRIGLHPDWGGTFLLPRLIGIGRAIEMFALGEPLSAAEAHRLGLVNFLAPHHQPADRPRKLAERLGAAPALPVALLTKALYERLETKLDLMMQHEVDAQMKCFDSEDFSEGLRAFLEKRRANFKGTY